MIDLYTTTPREMRDYAQLTSYLENRDNELVRVLHSGLVWNTPVNSRQLITEATRRAIAAENNFIKIL